MTKPLTNKCILQMFDFYREAQDSLRHEMEQAVQHAILPAGSYLFRSEDQCTGIPLVARGDVRVFLSGETSREITLYHVAEGQTCLLTLNCALQGIQYAANAIVEAEVEAAVLPVSQFTTWVDQHSELRRFMFEVMARRITELMTLVSEITFAKLDQRLAHYLLQRLDSAAKPDAALLVTHEHIAAELGSAREVISRVLKEFERIGVLTMRRGRIELQNPARLRELLSGE